MKVLAVVITYFPDLELLKSGIDSYLEYVDEVVIWDNTPQKEKKNELPDNDKIKYLSRGKNVGISQALNYVLSYAIDNKYDYLLTMDQDSSICNTNILFERVLLNSNKPLGIYGTGQIHNKSIKEGIKRYIFSFYSSLFPLKQVAYSDLNEKEKKKYSKKYGNLFNSTTTHYRLCRYRITSGSLIPISVLREIGGYEKEFFVDGIDVELSYRARAKGFYTYAINGCCLRHRFGESINKQVLGIKINIPSYSPSRLYGIIRNHLIIIRKYNSAILLIHFIKQYIIKFLFSILVFEENKRAKIKAIFAGVKDGFKYVI